MSVEFLAPLVTVIAGTLLLILLLWERRAAKSSRDTSMGPDTDDRQALLGQLSQLLTGAAQRDVFELSMGATVALGFDAASLLDRLEDTPVITFGDWRCVAPTSAIRATNTIFAADTSDTVVTTWRSDAQREIFSVSAVEPTTSLVVIGWSRHPVADELADDFARVVQLVSRALSSDPLHAEPSWSN